MDFIGDGAKAIVVFGDEGWVIDLRRMDVDGSGRRVFHWSLFEGGRYLFGSDDLRGPVGAVDVTAREMLAVLVDFLLADAEKFGSVESIMEYTTTEVVAEFACMRRAALEELAADLEEMAALAAARRAALEEMAADAESASA